MNIPIGYIPDVNNGAATTMSVTNNREDSIISDHNISESRRIAKELKKLREIREKREQLEKQEKLKKQKNGSN